MKLYNEGVAEISCWITLNYSYCLSFQKLGNVVVATNKSNVEHIVPESEKPETQDQFMTYTKRYYKLLEVTEN